LGGYRALCHYLAGSAAQKLSGAPKDAYDKVAREQFAAALNAAPNVPWLVHLTRGKAVPVTDELQQSVDVISQVERLEGVLLAMGTAHNKKFEKRAKQILEGLAKPDTFEEAQRQLGEMLGFVAGNGKGDADPDPWWLGDTKGIVFEDHANGQPTSVFGANKAKQATLRG